MSEWDAVVHAAAARPETDVTRPKDGDALRYSQPWVWVGYVTYNDAKI